MALAKQDVETKKKTNTTKQSNKEAIQNINRTGTVSGQASGVKNISAPIPKTNTDASNLAGVKYQTSNKTVNTGSKPTGVNTQSYNLAGSNNIKSAVGTPTKNQNTLKSNAYTANASNQRVGAETVERNQRKYQTTLSGLADNSTRTAHDILNTAGNYWNSAKQAVSNAVQENKLRASNTTAGLAYQRLEKQRADSIAHDEKERQETFKTISENDVNNFFDKEGNEIDFQKKVSDLETQLAGYDDLLAQELDDSQRMLYENQKLKTEQDLEYNREMLKKSRAYFETANLEYFKGDRDTYNSLRETYSHKDDSLPERFGTATAHLVASTINDIPTAMDQIKLAGQANVANDYIEQLKGLYETGQISDEAYAEGLRYWNDAIESYKQEYNDSFSQVMRTEVDQLSSNTHYGADQIQEFALNAGESTAQFLLHFAIGKGIAGLANLKNTEATAQLLNEIGGNIATTTMSISSATSKMNQLLDEGYSPDVAMKNGFLTGLISFVIEKTGSVDRFIDMLGTPVSVSTMGEVLLGVGKSGLSEGLEETVEDLLTPVVDFYTAGKDVEVNGNELLMSFLLGGTSGVLMAVSGHVVGTAKNVLNQRTAINELLRTNKALRAEVLNNIKQTSGNFVVNTRAQYNLLKSQIEQLNSYKGSMSPEQDLITEALTDKVYSALSDYENRSQVMGVTLTEDIVETPSEQEKEHVIYETLESDFNQEVKTNEEIEALQQKINEGLEELAVNDLATTEAIQQSLTEHGYDIDAELFQSLDEAKQNEVLVALDASKIKGINVNMMDDAGIRQFLLDNDPKLQKYAYNHTPEQVEAKINRIVSGTKGIRFGDQILINVNRSNAILSTFVHEITHGTENSALYDPLKEAVKNIYENWDDTVEKKAKVYDEIQSFDDPNKRFDNAEREVVAETVENNLGDEEFLDNLIRYDFSLVSRMYQNLKAFGSNDTVVQLQNAFEKAFRKYESQYRYSFSFDAKGNLVDNTGAPINKKMAERINGTKLTDAEGNPYRLYHTSEAFFNTLDPRGTDHYRFGNKVVNYFSNNEIVSGSYAGDEYRQITGEDSYNEYEADVLREQVLRDLIKEKDQEYRDSYEALENQMREAVRNEKVQKAVDAIERNIKNTDIFSVNSDPILFGLGSGYNQSLLSSIEYDISSVKNQGGNAPYFKISSLLQLYELRNGGKYFDAKPASEVRELLAPIDDVSVQPLIELQEKYKTETTRLLDELDELREKRENLERETSKGKQYVGYGKATNPYILENNSGERVDWNNINALDYRMSNEDFALIENEVLRASRNLGPEDFEKLRNKPGVNKWILNSISDEARDALAENPVMLANFASSLRDIFTSVDRNLKHPDLEFLKQEYPEAYKEEVRSIIDGVEKLVKNKLNTGREFNSQGTKYSDLNTLETNDVVGAILSLNEFAGTSYDGVVFKDITDSASYKAQGISSDIIALFEPNQFKLLENENPTDNPDFRYSYNPDENVGYHYGAENIDYNKKSERLYTRSGRRSGAFGTGTYFFGKEGAERAKGYHFTDGKTEHKVDFSDYNLFKPASARDGETLHEIFKKLDNNYKHKGPKTTREYWDEMRKIRDSIEQYEHLTSEQAEDLKARLMELGEEEDVVDYILWNNSDDQGVKPLYLDSDLRDLSNGKYYDSNHPNREYAYDRIKEYEDTKRNIWRLALILNEDEDNLRSIVNKAMRSAEADTHKADFSGGNYDSVGTRIMKALGYEGIDVRGIKELDDSFYGSVIYDLKPDSVMYSYGGVSGLTNLLRNGETKIYNRAMRMRELAQEMREEKNEDGSPKYTEREILKKTGWFIPEYESDKTRDRFEFYDDNSVEKLLDYVKNTKGISKGYEDGRVLSKLPTLEDLLGKDSTFLKMYPELGKYTFVVSNRSSTTAGEHDDYLKTIRVNKKNMNGRVYEDGELVDTIAHEIQHFIQKAESFEYDYKRRKYPDKPGEIEASNVGSKQRFSQLRGRDVINDKDRITDSRVGDSTYISVAPLYKTDITGKDFNKIINELRGDFKRLAEDVVNSFGGEIVDVMDNVGGYTHESTNIPVEEPSFTVELKNVSFEDAKAIASILGDMVKENQESVIAFKYREGTYEEASKDATAVEYTFHYNGDHDAVRKIFKDAGFNDFSQRVEKNEFTLLDFDKLSADEYDKMIGEVIDKLVEGGYYGEITRWPVDSELIGRKARQDSYKSWLETNNSQKENGGRRDNQDISSKEEFYELALQNVTGAINSASDDAFLNARKEEHSDLEVTDADLKKYGTIRSTTDRKYSEDKNIDKETGILKPKAIIELDTTIGKTTHEEEIQDGEEYAGKFVEALDNGADVDDLLQKLMDHPLENGLVRAYYVSQALADRGMESEYMELAQWARDIDNLGGKLIESTKILYNLDSTFSKAVYLTQVEENLKSEYKERLKSKKGVDVEQTISEIFNEYANKIINSKTSREFRSAIGALTREVNRRMPKTIWDRIHQYRMLAMLSGTKTAVSNFVSNTFSLGLYRMNSLNQALLESAMQNVEIKSFDDKKTYQIKQEDRNATLRKDSTATKRNRKLATEIWDSLGENEKTKYGIETEKIPDIIKNNLKIKNETTQSKLSKAVGGLFDTVQNVQGVLLNDAPFAKVAFVQKFDELARARGIDTEKINKSSKEYARLIDDAYNYAQEVVSHNDTDISKTIANLTRKSASNVRINEDSTLVGLDKQIKRFKERANNGEPIYRFIDSAVSKLQKWFVPFYKTNASLLQKSLQFSPLEWGQVINDWGKVKAGRMEVVDMVEHMSKAVTGTELYLAGAIFGFLGLLKWEKDDEDYSGRLSIKIPGTDKGYTVDFIDPISTIFAKGVVLAQNISEQGGPFKTIEGLVRDYEDIFLSDELDMFSSMKDFFDTVGKVRKGKDDYGEYTLGDGATDIAFSVLNSYIPSIVRDVSRMIDPAKKNVYDTDNKKYLFNRLVNSTPFRTNLVDKKDATGRTINYTQPFTGNDVFDRILTQMVSRGKLVDSNGQAITTRSGSQNMQATSSDGYTQMAKDFQYKDENGDGFSDAHWIRDSVPSNIYPAGVKTELTPKEKETYGKTWTDTWTSGANYLADNGIYNGLSYENQADVIYELQGFARECIEADYCMANDLKMTEAQRTANEIRNFCTVNGKLDGKMLGLIALGTAKENKLASGGQRYVMAEQDEEGKTIRNSRQLAMRHIYEEAGIYDKIVEAVQNSNGALTYADFGLGKTVVEKYSDEKAGSDYQTIYNKAMKSSSKKSSKVSGGSAGGITKAKGGGSTKKLSMAPNPVRETKVANSYLKAYADVFKRNSSKATSSSGSTVICPKCGNRVYAGAKRCPVCGTSL